MDEINIKIKRLKRYNEVSWLRDMSYGIVESYYQFFDFDYAIGDDIINKKGETIGTIIDITTSQRDYDENVKYALIKLNVPINYIHCIDYGIPIENLIFKNS